MNLSKWIFRLAVGLLPVLCIANTHEELLLERLKQINLVSDYSSEIEWVRLNVDKMFVFGNNTKLLVADGVFMPIRSSVIFEDEFYIHFSYLPQLCTDICKQIDHKNGHANNFVLIKDKPGGSPPSASELYSEARSAAIDFLGHSAAAGASIGIPPLAIYELYNAVEAGKMAADLYLQAVEQEKKERDDEEAWQNFQDMTKKED